MPPDSAEQLARMAAELRGVHPEAQADKQLAEAPQTEEPAQQTPEPQSQSDAEWGAKLFRTKAEHQRLIDSIHGNGEEA